MSQTFPSKLFTAIYTRKLQKYSKCRRYYTPCPWDLNCMFTYKQRRNALLCYLFPVFLVNLTHRFTTSSLPSTLPAPYLVVYILSQISSSFRYWYPCCSLSMLHCTPRCTVGQSVIHRKGILVASHYKGSINATFYTAY